MAARTDRPVRFLDFERVKTAEEARERIELFFANEKVLTITGLALYLGCTDKSEIYLLKEKPELAPIIKKAALHIEQAYELGLRGREMTGAIFALKNFGWRDTPETQINFGFGVNGLPNQVNKAQMDALESVREGVPKIESKTGQEYFEG